MVASLDRPTFHVDVEARCRRCGECLKARAALWRGRARAEIGASSRTWFGTLTLTAQAQFRALSAARQAAARKGTDFDGLSQQDQFRARCMEVGREVTLYLKRLRKHGAKIRYCLVFEAHKSGAPHCHVLIHERGVPVRHKLLSEQWRLGFTKFNLVKDNRAAAYITKYLTKAAIARIRASENYGADFVDDVKQRSHLSDSKHSLRDDMTPQTIAPSRERTDHHASIPHDSSEGCSTQVRARAEAFNRAKGPPCCVSGKRPTVAVHTAAQRAASASASSEPASQGDRADAAALGSTRGPVAHGEAGASLGHPPW